MTSVQRQVSIGALPISTTAKELTEYLEGKIGLICRCRLKTSWTPPGSFPDFEVLEYSTIPETEEYEKVEPHAFVHFKGSESVARAVDAARKCELILDGCWLNVRLGAENSYTLNQRRKTTTPDKFCDTLVQIGNLGSRDEFYVAWEHKGVNFFIDSFDNKCSFFFTKPTVFSFKHEGTHIVIGCEFKMEVLLSNIQTVRHYKTLEGSVLLLKLASSPQVWYRTADDDIYETDPVDLLDDDDDPWIRCTDFSQTGAIGRCLFYRVLIPPMYEDKVIEALKDRKLRTGHEECLSNTLTIHDEPPFVQKHSSDFFFCIHDKEGISFEIMFLVNSLLHKGVFKAFQLNDSIFDLLRKQGKDVNIASLKHLCTYKRPVSNAHESLKKVQEWIQKNPKLLGSHEQSEHFTETRKLVVTPTGAYCQPPEFELSNRVLRKYKDVGERFLRVTFMDEGMQTMNSNVLSNFVAPVVTKLSWLDSCPNNCIFERVRSMVTDGFKLCGRKYSFLAFSLSQLKDRSAWFFAETDNINCFDIRAWMGKFRDKNVAKCAARMGMCFSSTYATVDVKPDEVNTELPDIKRNGYVFSDGIGTITSDLAVEVKEKLKLDMHYTPCAYQIRYAGFKGVVACWPSKDDRIRLALRASMNKFISEHTTLEICSWSRFQPGFLNRQIITLLSALGVPDEIFSDMQESMLYKLNRILEDTDLALEILTSSCAEQGSTAAIMLRAGFEPKSEPFLRGMLSAVRIAQLSDIKEKSRLFVSSGRYLMGCLDEIGILEQGQCFIQVSKPSIENETDREVVEGYVVIAKNPCLHPGDVRILKAVDAPQLYHIYDCLLFPQKGDRPHPDEASGSDLDGDLYFVTWDKKLIPPRSSQAMEYDATVPRHLNCEVDIEEIIDFFVKNMTMDYMGAICNAHVVCADKSIYGANDPNCLKLAKQAAIAVDFPKTGKKALVPYELKPKSYPDFMGKEDWQTYKSEKIIGRLYRNCIDVVASSGESSHPIDIYDTDLEVQGFEDFILEAWDIKCTYDSQLIDLLEQYKVQNEEEIVTGHIWSMPTSKKQGDLKESLKLSYNTLKTEKKNLFEELNLGQENLSQHEKVMKYERKAFAWYHVTYHPKWMKKFADLRYPDESSESSGHGMMRSFAWIAAEHLVRIKSKAMGHV